MPIVRELTMHMSKIYLEHEGGLLFCLTDINALAEEIVEKRMRKVEAKNKELAVKYQSLEEAGRQMGVANQRLTETIQSIRQTQTKAINLIQEKVEVEKQLQLNRHECAPSIKTVNNL